MQLREAAMKAHHWFVLGMMAAWTPCLLALLFMLRRRIQDSTDWDIR